MVTLYSYKNIFLRFLAYLIDFFMYILNKIINQIFKNCDKNNFFIKDKIINLLIFKNDNLGDVYLFLPFLENMKKGLEQNGKYNDILIDISINPNSLPLVQNNPYLNNISISPYFAESAHIE